MQLSGDDAKQLKGDDYEWIKIGKLLHQHGIYAPQTVATIPDYAAIVIEDYGDTMMETAVLKALESGSSREALAFYQKSFDILGRFLQIEQDGSSKWRQRAFDADRFDWELHFFRENFLENVLEWKFSNDEMTNFSRDSLRLANYLAENSKFFVHRDFHSRNVMVKNLDLAVIDFQDARLGPPTYDIVSLCFDSYIPLEFATREQLLQEGLRSLSQAHSRLSLQALEGEWRGMLLQRQLKAIGSFGYLTIKKNRGNYLRYLNPALDTLPESKINDGRWPFLSGPMLKEMAERWRKCEKSL
jgi:aminoglycoside/choline kinase family phosphotransferase